jgi:hypothetical protein
MDYISLPCLEKSSNSSIYLPTIIHSTDIHHGNDVGMNNSSISPKAENNVEKSFELLTIDPSEAFVLNTITKRQRNQRRRTIGFHCSQGVNNHFVLGDEYLPIFSIQNSDIQHSSGSETTPNPPNVTFPSNLNSAMSTVPYYELKDLTHHDLRNLAVKVDKENAIVGGRMTDTLLREVVGNQIPTPQVRLFSYPKTLALAMDHFKGRGVDTNSVVGFLLNLAEENNEQNGQNGPKKYKKSNSPMQTVFPWVDSRRKLQQLVNESKSTLSHVYGSIDSLYIKPVRSVIQTHCKCCEKRYQTSLSKNKNKNNHKPDPDNTNDQNKTQKSSTPIQLCQRPQLSLHGLYRRVVFNRDYHWVKKYANMLGSNHKALLVSEKTQVNTTSSDYTLNKTHKTLKTLLPNSMTGVYRSQVWKYKQ